ncbi:hypothetical protein GCM10022211_02170 [Sphingomonas humi]|uniref:Uncharacterized protein n=1 Tax=Sphingomonas humi TaxID=335630 RepID=A0ABP7RFC0_9SPHN
MEKVASGGPAAGIGGRADVAGKDRAAEARAFKHVERAHHLGRGESGDRRLPAISTSVNAEIAKIRGERLRPAAAGPVGEMILDRRRGERPFKRGKDRLMRAQESTVSLGSRHVEGTERRIDAVVRAARRRPEQVTGSSRVAVRMRGKANGVGHSASSVLQQG